MNRYQFAFSAALQKMISNARADCVQLFVTPGTVFIDNSGSLALAMDLMRNLREHCSWKIPVQDGARIGQQLPGFAGNKGILVNSFVGNGRYLAQKIPVLKT